MKKQLLSIILLFSVILFSFTPSSRNEISSNNIEKEIRKISKSDCLIFLNKIELKDNKIFKIVEFTECYEDVNSRSFMTSVYIFTIGLYGGQNITTENFTQNISPYVGHYCVKFRYTVNTVPNN